MSEELKKFIEEQEKRNLQFKEQIGSLQSDLSPIVAAQLVDRMQRAENSLRDDVVPVLEDLTARVEKLEELTNKLSQMSVQDLLDDKAFKAAIGVVSDSVTTERERIDALTRFLGCIPIIKEAAPQGVLPGAEPCDKDNNSNET